MKPLEKVVLESVVERLKTVDVSSLYTTVRGEQDISKYQSMFLNQQYEIGKAIEHLNLLLDEAD